ncbi:MAG: hypothetical protein V4584_08120 [Verrucomicrobiota bacterium]
MRSLLTWLMVFSVLAGLNVRVLAADVGCAEACTRSVTCCDDHHETHAPASHQHDGKDCPMDHHHHHDCCSHTLPLTLDHTLTCRLGIPGSSLLGVRHEGEVPPEGPFLSSEKPPLI